MTNVKKITVPVKPDEEGYFDKQCPSKKCECRFKVFYKDWQCIKKQGMMYCPKCRACENVNSWNPPEVTKYIKKRVQQQATAMINHELTNIARNFNRRQSKNGLISIKVTEKSSQPVMATSPPTSETMQRKVSCPECSCKYAIVGSSHFCPQCGNSDIAEMISQTPSRIRTSVDIVADLPSIVSDNDTIGEQGESMIENGLEDSVSFFQNAAAVIYAKVTSSSQRNGNQFQNIELGSRKWQSAMNGNGFDTYLTNGELKKLEISFQQRHLIAHSNGIVDQKYIDNTKDDSYVVGQRIVVRKSTVIETVGLLEKLLKGMKLDMDSKMTSKDNDMLIDWKSIGVDIDATKQRKVDNAYREVLDKMAVKIRNQVEEKYKSSNVVGADSTPKLRKSQEIKNAIKEFLHHGFDPERSHVKAHEILNGISDKFKLSEQDANDMENYRTAIFSLCDDEVIQSTWGGENGFNPCIGSKPHSIGYTPNAEYIINI